MITIAWDVDDVLNELMRCWLEKKWLPQHPRTVTYNDITKNPPCECIGARMEEYLASLDDFRSSGRYQELRPVPEVKEWFLRHGHLFRHLAVTAVPVSVAHTSAEWVLKYFGLWIRTFHFVPSVRTGLEIPHYDAHKNDFIKWFGKIDVLIDDNEENINRCIESGTKGILFPRPWNSSRLTIAQTLELINTCIVK
ncbi:MAG: hypothetical protein PHV55_07095 [Candidatus Omnitrophica bacterium]|nr:hypothetical protein [Candidatus Omnitrophota bacterium]